VDIYQIVKDDKGTTGNQLNILAIYSTEKN